MENKQNVIEIEPDGIKKHLDKVLRGWAKQYAEATKKGPLKSNPYTQLRAADRLTADFILDEAARIEAKQSKLSSGQRAVVSTIMNDAIRSFLRAEGEKARQADAAAHSKPADEPKAPQARKSTTGKKTPAKAPKTAKE